MVARTCGTSARDMQQCKREGEETEDEEEIEVGKGGCQDTQYKR